MAMTDYVRRLVLDGAAAHCAFTDGGFVASTDSAQVLEAGRFALTDEDRLAIEQPSGFGEVVRTHLAYGPAYVGGPRCDEDIEANFLIEVDHAACEVRVTVRVALELDVEGPLNVWERETIEARAGRLGVGPGGPRTPDEIVEFRRRWFEEAKPRWQAGVEAAWSRRFNLVRTTDSESACRQYQLIMAVDWVTLEGDPLLLDPATNPDVDFTMTVRPLVERESTGELGLSSPPSTVAHEFGHWIGANDEYDGTCDGCPDRPIVDRSIMNDADAYPLGAMPHHLSLIRLWMATRLCAGFDVVPVEPGLSAGIGVDVLWNTDIPYFFYDLIC